MTALARHGLSCCGCFSDSGEHVSQEVV